MIPLLWLLGIEFFQMLRKLVGLRKGGYRA
jgi:hypothetical protein